MNFLQEIRRKRKNFIFLIFILGGIISFLILLPKTISALELEVSWPPSPLGTSLTENSGLVDLIRYCYEWIVSLGGIATLISLIIGGFRYITAAGNPSALADAKDRINSALIGLVLLLGSWLILNTINPENVIVSSPYLLPTSTLLQGVPTSTLKLAPCDHAIIYDDIDYRGSSVSISTGTSATFNFQPKSVKIVDASGTDCENATPKCGCTVKFHTATTCDDAVQWTVGPYSNPNLTEVELPDLRCAKVEGISF